MRLHKCRLGRTEKRSFTLSRPGVEPLAGELTVLTLEMLWSVEVCHAVSRLISGLSAGKPTARRDTTHSVPLGVTT